eukprot:10774956-Heterocapsa_arctica.AAC.1
MKEVLAPSQPAARFVCGPGGFVRSLKLVVCLKRREVTCPVTNDAMARLRRDHDGVLYHARRCHSPWTARAR